MIDNEIKLDICISLKMVETGSTETTHKTLRKCFVLACILMASYQTMIERFTVKELVEWFFFSFENGRLTTLRPNILKKTEAQLNWSTLNPYPKFFCLRDFRL